MTPPFLGQSALPSLPIYHQRAARVPPFSIFRKFCIFSLVLAKISALKTQNFPNFRSQDPLFFKENPLPRPCFWKPVWHIPTKIKLSAPPPVLSSQCSGLGKTKIPNSNTAVQCVAIIMFPKCDRFGCCIFLNKADWVAYTQKPVGPF